jgi:transposase
MEVLQNIGYLPKEDDLLGKRKPQTSIFTADAQYLDKVGRDTFYGFLATHSHQIFSDEEFSEFYCDDNGRQSVPPSILAVALLLQNYERVSDEEVVSRATFDNRWSVALGTEPCEQPFAKSTFQLFRAKLILNERAQEIFERSLSYAREIGFLKNRKMKLALDSTPILGRGAVKDTYNLLADGIRKLVGTLEKLSIKSLTPRLRKRMQRYFGKSFKGDAGIDWDNAEARQELLNSVVADVKHLLQYADHCKQNLSEDDSQRELLQESMRLLSDLVEQDVEEDSSGEVSLKQGVSKDRIVSVHDPEMRHGRKSKSHRFDGHKGTIAVDTETKLITATDVIAGNASDGENALALCEQSKNNTGSEVETAIGDTAYGTGELRKEFAEAEINLVAKAPPIPDRGTFRKEDFTIDLENERVTCPAGHTTTKWHRQGRYTRRDGSKATAKVFKFDDALCSQCEWYQQCVSSSKGRGRTIAVHPEEALLQEARAFQKTETFKEQYRERTKVEHRIARLMQLGVRKSHYFGREKTAFQLAVAAAVANFTLMAAWQLQNLDDFLLMSVFALASITIFAKLTVKRFFLGR